jgi:hypothetical protein
MISDTGGLLPPERFGISMKDDVIMAEVDGEGMIIDVERGSSHFLNETALLIYKMVREGKNRHEIKDAFLKEYDVDEEDAEKDIGDFLTLLESKAVSWEKRNT